MPHTIFNGNLIERKKSLYFVNCLEIWIFVYLNVEPVDIFTMSTVWWISTVNLSVNKFEVIHVNTLEMSNTQIRTHTDARSKHIECVCFLVHKFDKKWIIIRYFLFVFVNHIRMPEKMKCSVVLVRLLLMLKWKWV